MQYAGEFLALASAFFFGGSVVFMRLGLMKGNRDMGMLITLLVNNLINLVIVIAFWLLKLIPPLNLVGIGYFALAGFLTSNLGRLFQTISMESIGASRASAFKIAAPIFTILIGIFILKEQVSSQALGGMAVVLAGLLVITQSMRDKQGQLKSEPGQSGDFQAASTGDERRENQSNAHGAIDQAVAQLAATSTMVPVTEAKAKALVRETKFLQEKNLGEQPAFKAVVKKGVIFGILSGLAFSLGQVFRKIGVEAIPSSVVGVAIGSLVAIICYWLGMLRRTGFNNFKEQAAANYHSGFILSGIFSSLALYSFFLALQFTTVSKANVLVSTEVWTTMLIGYFVLGRTERINKLLVWGVIAVFSGIIVIILY